MKDQKLSIWLIIAGVALISAVVAVFMFKAQIFDFFVELKGRIEDKRCCRNGELEM